MGRTAYKKHIAICPHCQAIVEAKALTYQQWEVANRFIANVAQLIKWANDQGLLALMGWK